MIFTRRFGALAARPQFPDSPELQRELSLDVDLLHTDEQTGQRDDRVRRTADESAA